MKVEEDVKTFNIGIKYVLKLVWELTQSENCRSSYWITQEMCRRMSLQNIYLTRSEFPLRGKELELDESSRTFEMLCQTRREHQQHVLQLY